MVKHLKLIINNPKKIDKFFDKKELQLILNLYASMVSNGEWKDYGLNISKEEISFNIYKKSLDHPIYKITKKLTPEKKFLVKDGNGNVIKASKDLKSLISNIRWKKFKLVN
ncbi:MAG: hypothetical protein CMI75_06625 [Candidatus Pelagibacter sp.]|nr:hypothetical protein [Candidatus Pelagibacter sp.]OUT95746.1 MAG: hypothetical protein CBB96_03290 [Gammaproteobacteria bacterium TMED36]|tara:strand:- start:894 stop:1226 length:333 start_codon:yes stop_codon:yes gene_type:complete